MVSKWSVHRRVGDARGVVRDRGSGDRGNDLQQVILAESGRKEPIGVVLAQASTLLDHRSGERRQRGGLFVLGQATLANRLHVRRIDPFLERPGRMERNGSCAGIGHRVGEQDDLHLRLAEAAAMHVPEQANEAVDQNRRGGHLADDVRQHAERRVQLFQRRLRALGRGLDRMQGKVDHVSASVMIAGRHSFFDTPLPQI